MAIFAGALATAKAAFVGASTAIKAFIVKHSVGLATAANAATSVLTGSSFETKNKRVTFGRAGTFVSGKSAFSLPTVRVNDKTVRVPYGKDVSSSYQLYHSPKDNRGQYRKR